MTALRLTMIGLALIALTVAFLGMQLLTSGVIGTMAFYLTFTALSDDEVMF